MLNLMYNPQRLVESLQQKITKCFVVLFVIRNGGPHIIPTDKNSKKSFQGQAVITERCRQGGTQHPNQEVTNELSLPSINNLHGNADNGSQDNAARVARHKM